jgi:ABC-type uncharacterized transport system permease subunit
MELLTQIAQNIIATLLALFVTVNFSLVGLITYGGVSGVLGVVIGLTIMLTGILLSYLIFRFIRNVIIKSAMEE